jgi:hypothetical protein
MLYVGQHSLEHRNIKQRPIMRDDVVCYVTCPRLHQTTACKGPSRARKVREGDELAGDRINDAGFALSLEWGACHGPSKWRAPGCGASATAARQSG